MMRLNEFVRNIMGIIDTRKNKRVSGQNPTLESGPSPGISARSAEPEGSKRLILSISSASSQISHIVSDNTGSNKSEEKSLIIYDEKTKSLIFPILIEILDLLDKKGDLTKLHDRGFFCTAYALGIIITKRPLTNLELILITLTEIHRSETLAEFIYALVECGLEKPTKPEVYYRRHRGEKYDFYFNIIRPFSTAEEIREDLLEAVDRSERSDLPSP